MATIKVDDAVYSSVAAVLKTLKACVLGSIKSFGQISVEKRCTEEIPIQGNNFFMVSLYCGLVINQLINLQLFSFQGIVTSLQFKSGMEVVLSEISPLNENKTGMSFHLTLCKELSKHMSIFTKKKCILIFQSNLVFCHTCACLYSSASYFPTDIPFTVKSSNEVHFELASTSTAALILVKHIGQPLYGWPFEDFHSLVHASERKSSQCNVWAVVRNSVKVRD